MTGPRGTLPGLPGIDYTGLQAGGGTQQLGHSASVPSSLSAAALAGQHCSPQTADSSASTLARSNNRSSSPKQQRDIRSRSGDRYVSLSILLLLLSVCPQLTKLLIAGTTHRSRLRLTLLLRLLEEEGREGGLAA